MAATYGRTTPTSQHLGTGDYLVTFRHDRPPDALYSATLAQVQGHRSPTATRSLSSHKATGVRVRTYDDATPQDNGFHLIVVCS